jgi:two-component system CheB/CheR fusion protein
VTDTGPHREPRYVVGIGASAGGLDALERFFDNLPKNTGMAFVIVQHLSPDFKSLMDELLARHTAMPIRLVEDAMPVEADHVYLIPPKTEMIISGGRLLLSERDRQQELTLPIDVFFRSLAQDCGPRAVAIVMSGGGSDGSRGIRDVHDRGGLVVVQDTETAQFDGMPRTARNAGVAHRVLAPEEMPGVLIGYAAEKTARAQGAPHRSTEPQGLGVVYRMLLDEFGIDFTHYKPSTVTRRIERRLALAHSHDIDEYVRRLKDERGELDVLYRDLLIGVTCFFRDPQAFEVLEQQVLPALLQREPVDAPIRLWVAGCATGEEPYSMAIVLHDLMSKLGQRQVKIFATDVHRGSLEHAARALYPKEAVANLSEERLARYFIRVGDMYQVVPDLRQMVVFAEHNVIKDAPFTRIDLVTCRNLLIYLQPAAQQKVLSLFHFALMRGGVLFLGPSESAGPLARSFESVDKHWRLYRKHTDARVPIDTGVQPLPRTDVRFANATAPLPPGRYSLSHLLGAYEALLSEVMPPSFLLNERGELVHSFGGASRFLRLRDGRQGLDVLELVEPELKIVLVGALKRALNESSPIVQRGIRLGTGTDAGAYKLTVRRLASRRDDAPLLLVSFEALEGAARTPALAAAEIELDQDAREHFRTLETELTHTKENLQSAIEELEASNEELQASNEELQASNEELQSTNEELQSVNEELYTVNAEYQRKITELVELTNDIDNLLSSTEVGTIFLDMALTIRKFTPQIAESFDLVPHDVGRPIETFAHKLEHDRLLDDLKQVVADGHPIERELRGIRGKSFFLRILPYRVKGMSEGVVLTLIDVSGLKAAEDALFHERHLFNSLLLNIPDAIYFKDHRGRFLRMNHVMARRLGLNDADDMVGRSALELPNKDAALALHNADDAVLQTGQAQHYKLEKCVRSDGSEEWDLVTRLPLRDKNDEIVGIIVIFRDVSEERRADEKIHEAVRRRDQFLAMLSHELRNPLGAMVTATALLKADGTTARARDKFLGVLERQSQQMSRLLDDLLEVCRVTQNKIELKKSVVDLNAVVREAAEAVRNQMDARGIHFSISLEPTPVYVDGDPARLQQIHVNLLSNAAKYSANGGHVQLGVSATERGAVVTVRDDGAGIPANMLGSVFELFVQSSRTLDRAAGGLGVGLTLARSLVAMHEGTITAHSDGEGRGSEFVVELPVVQRHAAAESPAKPRIARPMREQARVVIVEDNADTREMLCELLASAGFDCRSAETGAAAMALIDEARPDIALLDVGLPGVDGLEIARRLRSDPRLASIRLIALTGYGQPSDRAKTLDAGFDAHLVKPVRADELLRLLVGMVAATNDIAVADGTAEPQLSN